jgi:hypothetical protein
MILAISAAEYNECSAEYRESDLNQCRTTPERGQQVGYCRKTTDCRGRLQEIGESAVYCTVVSYLGYCVG